MKYNKVKAIDINIFLIPMIIISVLFVFLSIFLSNQINTYYTNMMQKESNKLARNTSIMLSKSSAAFDTINEFMTKRVLDAAKELKNHKGNLTSEQLIKYAYQLNVDVIYFYNPQGEILASNSGEFIGFKTFDGHPVERFRTSELSLFVEDIRLDNETSLHFKYAYVRFDDGYFVQIGIYAEDVFQYLTAFDQQNIIDDLKNDESILSISIIDKKYRITSSSDLDSIGLKVDQKRLVQSNEGVLYQTNGIEVYEVFAPINLNSVNVGFLNIQYKLDTTKEIIRNMTQFGFVLLISFYIIVLSIVYSSYKKNKQLIELAYYDTLTKLPNIDYFKYYLEENLKKDKSVKTIILVNCINFKRINMSYGYKEGDFVLQKMAEKLKLLNSKQCKIFKFNADRFIVLIENSDNKDTLNTIREIETMFSSTEFKPDLDINMGVVEIEKVKQDVDDILRDVSIALNNVDNNQKYAIFDAKMEQSLHREDVIEEELKEALRTRDHKRIYFQYQPIYKLDDHSIVSFEALARLNTKHYGLVSPIEFIDIAERKHIIVPLGEYLLNEACLLIRKLENEGFEHIKIAVNISGIQVMQDEFVYSVERILKKHRINPTQLELEITESVYMQDFISINQKLFQLREMGISISMDDFGTGFSSFYRLKETYLDILKMDRYFIKNIDSNLDDKHISKDIISIAHKYHLKCVAEGIENVYQLEKLKNYKCDYGQGYFLSYPIDEDLVLDKLKQIKRVK